MNGGALLIRNILLERNLPNVLSGIESLEEWEKQREVLKDLLCKYEYGYFPEKPKEVKFEIIETDSHFCASNVVLQKIKLTVSFHNGDYSFPFYFACPSANGKYKTIVHISFSPHVPDKFMPSEELADNGFAVASFFYEDVTSDNDNFSNGLSGLLYPDGKRSEDSAGKISIWAWAAMRIMDFLETHEKVDLSNISIAGHSRLGKTALLTAALDERFAFVFANNSGCSGAAISRGKVGETIEKINLSFPYWFCKSYKQFSNKEIEMPFDQHFLLALIAPRKIYVSSAEDDMWADPTSEFLSCVAASSVYEKIYASNGLVHDDSLPGTGVSLHDGNIGYHKRAGTHYLSRYDWNQFMDYVKRHSQ